MNEIEKRLAFLHGEFADWFRARAPERYRTLAIVLHDGIRERIKELVADAPAPANDRQVLLARLLAAADAEFEAATGFRFEPWGDAPPLAQEIPGGGGAGVLMIRATAAEVFDARVMPETESDEHGATPRPSGRARAIVDLTGGTFETSDGRRYRVARGSIDLDLEAATRVGGGA